MKLNNPNKLNIFLINFFLLLLKAELNLRSKISQELFNKFAKKLNNNLELDNLDYIHENKPFQKMAYNISEIQQSSGTRDGLKNVFLIKNNCISFLYIAGK